jgi:polysaccharide chain length determinant protein (PEP-CTERM system associated)
MAQIEKPFNIQDYLAIGLRRKWYIIIPLIIGVLASFGVYKYLPKVFKASTLILVQSQRVPESYVRPTITDSVASRLNTISQEILSRTRLEKVIQEFNLYSEIRNNVSISFEDKDPKTVMMVTNKLASLFIEENLKVRESQAEGTSDFISKELVNMEERLKRREQDIRNFKERSMGQLPQQLDANLRILERLQDQLKTTNENMRAAEDRSVLFQNQIEQLKMRERFSTSRGSRGSEGTGSEELNVGRGAEDPLVVQYNNLRRELATAQSKYKDTHPDVIDLKRKIANLAPQVETKLKSRREGIAEENLPPPRLDSDTERLITQYTEQYNNALLEAKRAKEEIKNLKEQTVLYQRRIEDTPRREQELVLLTRDYDLLKTNYQSLSDKKIQSQMAENLERKQQGEQFKILDPARIPEKPIKPDRNRILLMGAVIGLAAGLGLAWFRESMDQTFHTVSDVEDYLGIPVIAALPNLKEEEKKAA